MFGFLLDFNLANDDILNLILPCPFDRDETVNLTDYRPGAVIFMNIKISYKIILILTLKLIGI